MNRTILFFVAVILLASAGNTQAAFQDKKAGCDRQFDAKQSFHG
jgi:1,4-dihydroxy-2-naphthoate octaprenyltransferase